MKKHWFLWLVLPCLFMSSCSNEPTCEALGQADLRDDIDGVNTSLEEFPDSIKRPFINLKKHAKPGLTKKEVESTLFALNKIRQSQNLGTERDGLLDKMAAACDKCLTEIRTKGGRQDENAEPEEPSNFLDKVIDFLMLCLAVVALLSAWRQRKAIADWFNQQKEGPTIETGPKPDPKPKATSDLKMDEASAAKTDNAQLNALTKAYNSQQNRLKELEDLVKILVDKSPTKASVEQTVEQYLLKKANLSDTLLVKASPLDTGSEARREPNGFTNISTEPGVFYMPSPSPDGSFSVSNQNPGYRPGTSIYKFDVLADNPTQAEFILIDSPETLRRILNLIETYVEPVCTSINGYLPDAKRIFTTNPGRAERQNDRWVVKQKAEIKYV